MFKEYASYTIVEDAAQACELDNWSFQRRFGFGTHTARPTLSFTILPEKSDFRVEGNALMWDTTKRAQAAEACLRAAFNEEGVFVETDPVIIGAGQMCSGEEVPDPSSIEYDDVRDTLGFGARFDCIASEEVD